MSKKPMGIPEGYVTQGQAARILKVSSATVYKMAKQGVLNPHYEGRRCKFYRKDDVVNLLQIFNKGTDLSAVTNLAIQALARVEYCEKKLNELLEFMNLKTAGLNTTEEGIMSFYRQASLLRLEPGPNLSAPEVSMFSKKVLAINEDFLRLVKMVTLDQDPWRVFLEACEVMLGKTPFEIMTIDRELSFAYGLLEAARRHIRSTAYFYVRTIDGKYAANEAFIGEGAFTPLITTLFPQPFH